LEKDRIVKIDIKSRLVTHKEQELLKKSILTTLCNFKNQSVVFVELGVKRAVTSLYLYVLLSFMKVNFELYCIDSDPRSFIYFKKNLQDKITKANPAKFFEMSTVDAAQIIDILPNWIFVDACHCFECVTIDINLWGAKLKEKGHLVLHDTTSRRDHYQKNFQHNNTRKFGVTRAVKENKMLHSNFKLLDSVDDVNGIEVYEKVSHYENAT